MSSVPDWAHLVQLRATDLAAVLGISRPGVAMLQRRSAEADDPMPTLAVPGATSPRYELGAVLEWRARQPTTRPAPRPQLHEHLVRVCETELERAGLGRRLPSEALRQSVALLALAASGVARPTVDVALPIGLALDDPRLDGVRRWVEQAVLESGSAEVIESALASTGRLTAGGATYTTSGVEVCVVATVQALAEERVLPRSPTLHDPCAGEGGLLLAVADAVDSSTVTAHDTDPVALTIAVGRAAVHGRIVGVEPHARAQLIVADTPVHDPPSSWLNRIRDAMPADGWALVVVNASLCEDDSAARYERESLERSGSLVAIVQLPDAFKPHPRVPGAALVVLGPVDRSRTPAVLDAADVVGELLDRPRPGGRQFADQLARTVAGAVAARVVAAVTGRAVLAGSDFDGLEEWTETDSPITEQTRGSLVPVEPDVLERLIADLRGTADELRRLLVAGDASRLSALDVDRSLIELRHVVELIGVASDRLQSIRSPDRPRRR